MCCYTEKKSESMMSTRQEIWRLEIRVWADAKT